MIRILNIEPEGYSEEARSILKSIGTLDEKAVQPGELLSVIKDYDVLIVRLRHQIDKNIIEGATRLKAIVTATTGLDHIDAPYASKKNIEVLSLKGETGFLNTIWATAELTWALLLSLLRRIPAATRDVEKGNWDRDKYKSRELHGKILGVIGYGRIGSKIAAYGKAFGMQILAYEVNRGTVSPEIAFVNNISELMSQSDVISIHVPLEEKTRLLIGEEELYAAKKGAILINTSRGEILDEKALLHSLRSGHLAGAALDVLTEERRTSLSANPLIEYAAHNDNLLITPHIGGATYESMEKTEVFMAKKLAAFIKMRKQQE